MKKKLNENELSELFGILQKYQSVFDELTGVESEIEKLYQKQKDLTESLVKIREQEKLFTENIILNYGKGKFNMETLEYELIN
jgi:hypothetical protein